MKDDRCEENSHYGCNCTNEPRTWATDIYEMHEKFGAHTVDFDGKFLEFRINFLKEELKEFLESIDNYDAENAVDALIDLCVVAIGTLDLGGVHVDKAWNEVLEKNMQKEAGENPSRTGSGGYDLIKPQGWTPPNHEGNTGYFGLAIRSLNARQKAKSHLHSLNRDNVPSHIKTLQSYIDHAKDKTHDYDDDKDPEFFHANYYPGGINDIMYEISKKVRRIRHGLKRFFETGKPPKTDSLHDSFRDISIYSAIGDTYLHGNLEGQTPDRDIFNREIQK